MIAEPPVPTVTTAHPRISGLLEAALMLPPSLEPSWRAGLRSGVRVVVGPKTGGEVEAWVGLIPAWVCLRCDGVFLAPWRIPVIGQLDHHRGCRRTGLRSPDEGLERWSVLMRVRDADKARSSLAKACAEVGASRCMTPWLSAPIQGGRADERWFEVWATHDAMADLIRCCQRIRETTMLPRPESGTSWL